MQILNKTTGDIILTTGDMKIPKDSLWKMFGFEFELPAGVSQATFRIINRENSLVGNEWGLDDIEIRFCAPHVQIELNDVNEYCIGSPVTLSGTYMDDGTFGDELIYRWEHSLTGNINEPSEWSIVADSEHSVSSGEVNASQLISSMALSDTGYYRLVVSSPSSIDTWSCRAASKVVQLTAKNCNTNLMGTVFPFVRWNVNEFDSLFTITVNLKSVPNLQSTVPLDDLMNETPLYSTEAIYYDGAIFVPNSPKSPGFIGALNNYGLPIDWMGAIHVSGSAPVTDILQENEQPVTVNGQTLGLFRLENVLEGDYILEIKREGYVTRWAKITVEANNPVQYLGHREIVPGDINDDRLINFTDAAEEKLKIGGHFSFPGTTYLPKYDLNADGKIDQLDLNIILKFSGFKFYHYEETLLWWEEY